MLAELTIADLVLIAEARLELAAGLNVITGETGAGKTLLAQGIGLLLGQKGEESLVRPGSDQALVQAVFDDDDETLSVARRITRKGRSRSLPRRPRVVAARGRDRAARTGRFLRAARARRACCSSTASSTCSTPGQRSDVAALLTDYGTAWAGLQTLSRELVALRGEGRDRDHEVDLLRFQVDEIDRPRSSPPKTNGSRSSASVCATPSGSSSAWAARPPCYPTSRRAAASTPCATAERLLAEAESLDPRARRRGGAPGRPRRRDRRRAGRPCATTSTT